MSSHPPLEAGRRLLLAGALAALGATGCAELPDGAGAVEATQSPIIGGTTIDVATRRRLGLVTITGTGSCSGSLVTPDWVLTANHCVNYTNVAAMKFYAPRTDGLGEDWRAGSSVVALGSADEALINLQPGAAGNMWPQVYKAITTSAESALVHTDVTCYGRGGSGYAPNGGITNDGLWRSLTKNIDSLTFEPIYGDYYTVTGVGTPATQILSWGDSGSTCLGSAGDIVAVETSGDCSDWVGKGQPGDTGCTEFNVKSGLHNVLRLTVPFRSYINEAVANRAAAAWSPMTLLNGWSPAAYGTNRVSASKGAAGVTLRGAMKGGSTAAPFVLSNGLAPNARVYVPLVTANASIGRAVIESSGAVTIESEGGAFTANAANFTSLDGVTFAADSVGYTNLNLVNGWTVTPYAMRAPAVKLVNGFVRFQGAMRTYGTNPVPFSVPDNMRPTVMVYMPVSMCNGTKGRLVVYPSGSTFLQAENDFSNATCFTSLEGAAYPLSESAGATMAILQSYWVHNTYGTGAIRFRNDQGIVRFQGGASGGTSTTLFTLPPAYRPATNVYIYVDLFGGKRGRVLITPAGAVTLDQPSQLATATQFISLEGASFGL